MKWARPVVKKGNKNAQQALHDKGETTEIVQLPYSEGRRKVRNGWNLSEHISFLEDKILFEQLQQLFSYLQLCTNAKNQ